MFEAVCNVKQFMRMKYHNRAYILMDPPIGAALSGIPFTVALNQWTVYSF